MSSKAHGAGRRKRGRPREVQKSTVTLGGKDTHTACTGPPTSLLSLPYDVFCTIACYMEIPGL